MFILKLICINNKPITHSNGICSHGSGLIEGEVYTSDSTIHVHPNNKKKCYMIIELNELKLVTRFIPLSDIDESALIKYKKETEEV